MSTTTIRPTEPPAPATAAPGESPRASRVRLAGASFVGAAAVILMGIVTAEALYPATYTTFENEISDLGATRPPNSVILQPSATIFDVSMIVAGLAILAGAWLLWRQVARRGPVFALGVLGFGVLGVGVFPGNTGAIHQILSLVAFGAGGVAALLAARIATGPFRRITLAVGAISLGVLVSYLVLGDAHPMADLGDGGVERWIAYPIVLWIATLGGWLMSAPRELASP